MRFFEKIKAKLNIKSKKQLVLYIVALVSIVALLTLGGITLAKYISTKNSDALIDPKGFYFDSNLLTKEGSSYEVGTNSITFDLKSYDDALRSSEVDITYAVSITCSDGGVEIPAGINTAGTLAAGKSKITVEYNGLTLGKTYTVTARATAPYTKSLSATFTLPDENNAVLRSTAEDASGMISYLTLKTGNVAKSGVVLWQDGYVPYSVGKLEAAASNSHNVTLEPNSTYVFTFFKSKLDTVYDSGEFVFRLPGEFADTVVKNNFDTNDDITNNGVRYYLKNGANPTNDYSASGYITINSSNWDTSKGGGNPHVQFKFNWSDYRFLFWDNNSNGKFGYGYFNLDKRSGVGNGVGTSISETAFNTYDETGKLVSSVKDVPYADVLDVTAGPVTLKWQVILTGNHAYFFINNELIFDIIPTNLSQGDIFNVGALRVDYIVFGVELVAKSENEAAFNEVLDSLGIAH